MVHPKVSLGWFGMLLAGVAMAFVVQHLLLTFLPNSQRCLVGPSMWAIDGGRISPMKLSGSLEVKPVTRNFREEEQ